MQSRTCRQNDKSIFIFQINRDKVAGESEEMEQLGWWTLYLFVVILATLPHRKSNAYILTSGPALVYIKLFSLIILIGLCYIAKSRKKEPARSQRSVGTGFFLKSLLGSYFILLAANSSLFFAVNTVVTKCIRTPPPRSSGWIPCRCFSRID